MGAVAVLLVAALVVYIAILRPRTSSPAGTAPSTQTAQAALTTFEQTVTSTGTLTPTVQEQVSFEAPGTVQTVDAAPGDTVEEGQPLATIDTLQLDAALAQANADLAQANAALADAQEADDGSAAAQAAVEARQAAVTVAQQAYADAEAAMSDATLTAPAAGLVTAVGVTVGDAVGSSDTAAAAGTPQTGAGAVPGQGSGAAASGADSTTTAAFTIVGTDAWTVRASVGESDVAAIESGDQVEMTSDDLTETLFGTVSEIGRLPSTTQGAVAYPLNIAVTGSPDGLHDGVGVDVSIITERRTDVLAVPAAAVSTTDDGETVVTLVAGDGSATEQPVETGETSGQMVEIVSGLSEGDTVQYAAFTPGATGEQGGTGGQRGLREGFDPSQLPEGFDPSQLPGGGRGPGGQGFPGGGFPGGDS